jgi:hypothetical protein
LFNPVTPNQTVRSELTNTKVLSDEFSKDTAADSSVIVTVDVDATKVTVEEGATDVEEVSNVDTVDVIRDMNVELNSSWNKPVIISLKFSSTIPVVSISDVRQGRLFASETNLMTLMPSIIVAPYSAGLSK